MTFFTKSEYYEKYNEEIPDDKLWYIEVASEMIYAQVGLTRRDNWYANELKETDDLRGVKREITSVESNVPLAIRNAAMEQCRFLLEYEIPLFDNRGEIKAGNMVSDLKTHYSELALMILANNGYLYRGNPINQNMSMELPF